MSVPATPASSHQNHQRRLTGVVLGVVISDRMDKTRTVSVDYQQRHPKYGKYFHRQAKYHVHDQNNESGVGDRVEIAACRRLSKTKSWRVVRVTERAPGAAVSHHTEAPLAEQDTPAAEPT